MGVAHGFCAATAEGERSRWLATGRSRASDAYQAGVAAATQAVGGRRAKLLLVFCAHGYDLGALLRGLTKASGGAPLVGCSTAGEIAADGPGDASVVVMALGGDGFSVATAAATGASSRLREASAEVAGCMASVEDRGHRALLLLSDGLAGDQQEVVRGAYGVVGASVPLVGGCAGDDLKMRTTFQLHAKPC